jgi:hypothetical protein
VTSVTDQALLNRRARLHVWVPALPHLAIWVVAEPPEHASAFGTCAAACMDITTRVVRAQSLIKQQSASDAVPPDGPRRWTSKACGIQPRAAAASLAWWLPGVACLDQSRLHHRCCTSAQRGGVPRTSGRKRTGQVPARSHWFCCCIVSAAAPPVQAPGTLNCSHCVCTPARTLFTASTAPVECYP